MNKFFKMDKNTNLFLNQVVITLKYFNKNYKKK